MKPIRFNAILIWQKAVLLFDIITIYYREDIIMKFIIDFVKGMVMGIANIIPGVSGGTMAVSMGIYDKLLYAINHLFKEFKKCIFLVLPIALGMAVGIGGFTFIIPTLLTEYPLPTCFCFIGLILGGVPMILKNIKEGLNKESAKIGIGHIIAFILLCAGAILLAMGNTTESTTTYIDANVINMIILLVVGVVASATMIIPGVSGSMVLMILGYYAIVTGTLKSFLTALVAFDVPTLVHDTLILFPFGIGVLLGIFLIAKLIEFLFNKYCSITYCAILGLIASSPVAILVKMGNKNINVVTIVLAVILLVVSTIFTYYMGKKEA